QLVAGQIKRIAEAEGLGGSEGVSDAVEDAAARFGADFHERPPGGVGVRRQEGVAAANHEFAENRAERGSRVKVGVAGPADASAVAAVVAEFREVERELHEVGERESTLPGREGGAESGGEGGGNGMFA